MFYYVLRILNDLDKKQESLNHRIEKLEKENEELKKKVNKIEINNKIRNKEYYSK